MKAFYLLSISWILFLLSCSAGKDVAETVQKITNKVENRNFVVNVNYAIPMRMGQVALTSSYTLKIQGDSVFAYLPYYGVAQTAPYGFNDGGIKFNEKAQDFKIISNKKKDGWIISFKINTVSYHYQFKMDVFNTGKTDFRVTMFERDPIDFSGDVEQ